MRKIAVLAAFGVMIMTQLFLSESLAQPSAVILPVENWIKVGEERFIFNQDKGSGLVKRYYVDPAQHDGTGSTLSVFYKDGSEELFWKGWNLYTESGVYAVKFGNSFYAQPRTGPMTSQMITLSAMTDFIRSAGGNIDSLKWLNLCLMNEQHGILTTDDGKEVCYKVDFLR